MRFTPEKIYHLSGVFVSRSPIKDLLCWKVVEEYAYESTATKQLW